ncbi:MAG: hypothetical protein AAB456_02380 [Patescibacteria group bacterium]
MKLVFGKANAKLIALEHKLKKKVFTFSVLSGFTCPGANECRSFAMRDVAGKAYIQDAKSTVFRCFSASQEVLFPSVYNARKANMELIKMAAVDVQSAANHFVQQIPAKCQVLRWHIGGDFATQAYFDMAIEAANLRPDILFYAYTKSIPFWIKRLNDIPTNFVLTASLGSRYDDLIRLHNLRSVIVVGSEYEARKLRLAVDHDDSHATKNNGKNFALTIHNTQPKGGKFAKRWNTAKATQGYNHKKTLAKIGG